MPNKVDMRTRQARAAQEYMRHKGYAETRPVDMEEVEGQMCWYFYYDLPEGRLELEVSWHDGQWSWMTTAFDEHQDQRGQSVPA